MRTRALLAGLTLLLASIPGRPAGAEVAVEFIEPQRYTDAGPAAYGGRGDRLAILERHLKTQGARCLAAGEALELRVVDVDLAGHHEWWRGNAYDLRVMREITWPRLEFDYVWRDATGRVLGQGREEVADMNYLWRSAHVRHDLDVLPYEKAMLQDWFEGRICRGRSAPSIE